MKHIIIAGCTVVAFLLFSCQGGEKKDANQNAKELPVAVNNQPPVGANKPTADTSKPTADTSKAGNTTPANNGPADYTKPEMVFVKGGTFQMGSNMAGDEVIDEAPVHSVTVSDYWIGKYEVTVGEFRKFMNTHTYVTDAEKAGFSFVYDHGSLYRKNGITWEYDVIGNKRVNQENHPVIHVSRNDAEAYCNWLSKQTGKTYRLLTEAEWEYAAKGGPKHEHFLYSGGNDMDKVGWYVGNSEPETHPVGLKKPNGLGIYDMSGNAWEWCADWYGMYGTDKQTDPKGPATGTTGILRGGGWRYLPVRTRVTARRGCIPGFNGSGIGFRLGGDNLK